MIKYLREYGWVLYLGAALPAFENIAFYNSWQWWAIIIPTSILVVLREGTKGN